ncbi:MAG: molybdopterin biosynthesis protein, partial [Chloroflexi bacterium]|nr:molybdopterin biosynthesis protein [Chloroflexota bacterium]
TKGATETAPLGLKIGDGAVWVDTGDTMPDGYDAVVMVEHVHEVDASTVEIMAPVPPYHHVRALGEDIVATELLLPESHVLRPVDVGACAAAGLTRVQVRQRPSVAVLPTGSELVVAGSALRPGEIVEFNSLMLAGLIDAWGGLATRHPPIPDDYERLRSAVLDLVRKHDIVVINAGSSAGSEDYTARLVEELGDLIVHGVAYRPGHPVVLGVVEGKPVLGIPGYPVSAVLTCEIFVKPLIERKLGVRSKQRERIEATLSRKVASPIGEDEHIRVALGRVGERMIATPIQRGAGVITSLVRADGLVTVPRLSEGVEAGALVEVELLRHREEIERKIVATGSHDLTLDLLASRLRRTDPGLTLSSSNVGSLGGLMALSRREAHLAGTHLLDEETGEYNLPFVRRYLKGQDVVVVHLVGRVQGLMVTHGNPKGVSTLSDLAEDGMSFVNRQRGSGTRVLLDYRLKGLGIEPAQIAGYEREEYTHLGVAAAVAGGRADTGLGILSAARAMGLDFVPLLNEQYDIVVPTEFYEADLLKPLLDLIRSAEFRFEVEALGGYDASAMGEVVEGSDGD